MFPPYYFSNSVALTGSCAKIVNRMLPYLYPLLSTLISFFPSFHPLCKDVPSAPVNMFTHTVFAQPALEMLAA